MLWPLNGLVFFLGRPRLWARPLAAVIVGWGLIIAISVGVSAGSFPPWQLPWWDWLLQTLKALGYGIGVFLALWVSVVPLLLSLAFEHLARAVQRASGASLAAEEPLARSLVSTCRVIIGTLTPRIFWLVLGIAAIFAAGPASVIVGAVGMAWIAVIDSVDVALAVRGVPGGERLAIMRAHRDEMRLGALAAAALNVALGLTIVGWLFWLPALVCGAAALVLRWPEVASGKTIDRTRA
jgi:hypothetical protein